MGVIIADIVTLVYYAVPANGISFDNTMDAPSPQATQSFVPPRSAPSRGSGGCGV